MKFKYSISTFPKNKHLKIKIVFISRLYATLMQWQKKVRNKQVIDEILPCCLLLVSFHVVACIHTWENPFYMGKQIKKKRKHFPSTEYTRICFIETQTACLYSPRHVSYLQRRVFGHTWRRLRTCNPFHFSPCQTKVR